MDELASYRLSDFILFSDEAYYRLFELYNQAAWPLHIVAILFALLLFYIAWKRPGWGGRAVAGILVACWLWVAWAFLYERFYTLHVVANWYALGFVVHAGLMGWYGLVNDRLHELSGKPYRAAIGSILLMIALVVYPLLAVASGRPWIQFELFGLAPDPTVLATIAILVSRTSPWPLYLLPFTWVLISGVTLYAM